MKHLLLGVVVLLSVLTRPATAQDENQELKAFKQEVENYLKKQAAAISQDLKARQELFERQQAEMEAQAAAIKGALEGIKTMQTQIEKLAAENAKLKETVAQLQAGLNGEQQARLEADQKIVKHVTEALQRSVSSETPVRPTTGASGRKYRVTDGDTLSAIAKAFKTSVAAIKEANNLKNDVIRPGQELIIPEGR